MAKKQRSAAGDPATNFNDGESPPTAEAATVLRPSAETLYAGELHALGEADSDPRPPGWRLSPRAVRSFLCGSARPPIRRKFYRRRCHGRARDHQPEQQPGAHARRRAGDRQVDALGIAGRGDLRQLDRPRSRAPRGRPRTTSSTHGTMHCCWPRGPRLRALVASPLYVAMRDGLLVRFEEITRCPPEIQDTLVSILSEKVMIVPELDGPDRMPSCPARLQRDRHRQYPRPRRARDVQRTEAAVQLRDRPPDPRAEAGSGAGRARVRPPAQGGSAAVRGRPGRGRAAGDRSSTTCAKGVTGEGIQLERPSTVMSTAEAVSVGMSAGLDSYYFTAMGSCVPATSSATSRRRGAQGQSRRPQEAQAITSTSWSSSGARRRGAFGPRCSRPARASPDPRLRPGQPGRLRRPCGITAPPVPGTSIA